MRADAAMVLAGRCAGRIVVGEGWRDGDCQEGRAHGGDQETLHRSSSYDSM